MKIVVSVVRRKRTVCCKRITEPNGNNKRGGGMVGWRTKRFVRSINP